MTLFRQQPELARSKGRHLIMLVFMFLVFLAFAGRLYQLQITRGDEFAALSESNFVSYHREVALRGMIYDRNGQLLADNRPSFNLYFTPAYCRDDALEPTLARLTEYLGLSDLEIDATRTYHQEQSGLDRLLPMLVRRNMSRKELAAVEQHRDLLDGVEVRPETSRAYPRKDLAAHLLGYVGEISPAELTQLADRDYRQGDTIGKTGIERAWEDELRGKNGRILVVKDNRGQRVPDSLARKVLKGREQPRRAVAGNNLILSIDARLQALAEQRFPGHAGAAVAIDPRTGFVLAMVSKPAFDPNMFSTNISARWLKDLFRDPDRPLTNRAIQQHYPPGSTFKPFTGFAALSREDFTENTRELCTGAMRFGDHRFRCWRAGGHGNISIHKAIVQSCDVFFYKAGLHAGMDVIARMSKSFGFGARTGFREGEETPGIMPNKQWYQKHTKTGFLPGFTVSNSIGQGDVNVTPLQLALAYATIANGGTVYRPQVVWRIESADGRVVEVFDSEVRGRALASDEHLGLMAAALEGVANEPGGTAYYRRPRGVAFKVAGKTGTAQVVKQGADRGKNLPWDFRDHAWFAAYAPTTDPQIAVAVVNEHGGHGSSGAAPLAMTMITYYLEQLQAGELKAEAPQP